MKPYAETIPGTDLKFDMVPIPGGTFTMGSPPGEAKRAKDEEPQHQVEDRAVLDGQQEVTWDEYDQFAFSLDLKKKKREDIDLDEAVRTEKKADAVTRPTPPYADETFGYRPKGQPAICITHHAAMEYCRWLSAKTGKTLSPADRGRVGICLPRRHQDRLFLGDDPPDRRICLVRRQRREAPAGRQEEAEPLGPLRHARQRRGVVPGPLRRRRLQQFADGQAVHGPGRPARRQGISLRGPRRLVGR